MYTTRNIDAQQKTIITLGRKKNNAITSQIRTSLPFDVNKREDSTRIIPTVTTQENEMSWITRVEVIKVRYFKGLTTAM